MESAGHSSQVPSPSAMSRTDGQGPSPRALLAHALPVAVVVLGLIYYWFAVADRYAVFLYQHSDGSRGPAQPFDAVTSSRYWMSGFVAAGVVAVLYPVAVWGVARWARFRGRVYRPPPWWRVWLVAAVVVGIGVPATTMTVNVPTLPARLALAVTATALGGLALALAPGEWIVRRPRDLTWLALDGLALMPLLAFWRAIELPERGIMPERTAWQLALGSLALSACLLLLLTAARRKLGRTVPSAMVRLAAGLWWLLLFVPLVHYLVFTPAEYRYITSGENVLGWHPWTAVTAVVLAGGVAALTRVHLPLSRARGNGQV